MYLILAIAIWLVNIFSLVLPVLLVGYYLAKGLPITRLSKLLIVLGCVGTIFKQLTIEGHPHEPNTEIMIAVIYFLYITFVLLFGLLIKFLFKKLRNT